jgi:hypothetical protein
MEPKESVKVVHYKNGFIIRRKNNRITAFQFENGCWNINFDKCIKESDIIDNPGFEKHHDLVQRRIGLVWLHSSINLTQVAFESMSVSFLQFTNIDWNKFKK